MPEKIQIENESSGSKHRVALELMETIRFIDESQEYKSKDLILDLYAECLLATNNSRQVTRTR